jgi:hypothetical protein
LRSMTSDYEATLAGKARIRWYRWDGVTTQQQ